MTEKNTEYSIPQLHPEATDKKRFLIVNGDDLCKNENTNNAIIAAYRKGILTSTSAFINMEGSVEQLKKIHLQHPGLPIGLHLNLTLGSPVTDPHKVKGITDSNGRFYEIDTIMKHLPDMNIDEVSKEMHAQADLFVSSGIPMDHIDYHHHLPALFTPFFKTVREIALKHKVPLRNPVPASMFRLITLNSNGGGGSAGLKKLIRFAVLNPLKVIPVVKNVGREALFKQKEMMLAEGIKTSNWFIDSFYNNASVDNFISILNQLPEGLSEIVCHPGLENELEVLTDEKVKETIATLNIELVSWNFLNKLN